MADYVVSARCSIARAVKARDRAAETAARRDFAEARIADRIQTVLADAPELRPEQRDRLIELLRPVRKRR